MLAAASVDPTLIVLPNRIIDMVTLVQQIRRFINDDDDGRQSMALPPTDKGTRKNIHELALAFNMKSISKGHGDARYTTLTKTSRSGLDVDEKKVAKIVRRKNYSRENNKDPFVKEKYRGDSFVRDKKGKKSRTGAQTLIPRHREGEEVGKVKEIFYLKYRSLFSYYHTSFFFCFSIIRLHRNSVQVILGSACWQRWDGQKVNVLE